MREAMRDSYLSRFYKLFRISRIPLMRTLRRVAVSLVLMVSVAACGPDEAVISESQYSTKLVGDWQGTVAGESEYISFHVDGSFTSQLQQMGFINTTLGQAVSGSISGRWHIHANVITLVIKRTEHEEPLNIATTSTIVSFKQNELVINSTRAGTSVFARTRKL